MTKKLLIATLELKRHLNKFQQYKEYDRPALLTTYTTGKFLATKAIINKLKVDFKVDCYKTVELH